MHEEMMLFDSLANGEYFKNKSIIVFLNKIEIFKKKLASSPLNTSPTSMVLIQTCVLLQHVLPIDSKRPKKTGNRAIYIHCTNANDTKLLGVTIASVLLRENCRSAGLKMK